MTSQIEKGLQSCPFCGGKELSVTGSMSATYVRCPECKTSGPTIWHGGPTSDRFVLNRCEDEAISAWNRRALTATGESKTESSPEVTEAMVEALRQINNLSIFSMTPMAALQKAWQIADAALSVGREGAAQGRDAVRVKPLVWTGDHSYTVASIVASSLVGKYTANVLGAAYHQGQLIGSGDSIHAAEALCQSDYTARILAALDTSPEGMVEERI